MGDIFIAWDDNHVLDLISNQKSTTLHEKAEQFRLLKEEFRDTGRYIDEDIAYVYFKRYELMSEYEQAKEKGMLSLFLFILFFQNFNTTHPFLIGPVGCHSKFPIKSKEFASIISFRMLVEGKGDRVQYASLNLPRQ